MGTLFYAGWCGCPCTHVLDVTGRASSSVTGVEVTPTDSIAGAGPSPEALAQCLWWFNLNCEWPYKQQGNTFFSSKPFAFSKAIINCQGAEHGAQRNCVQTNLFLLWAFMVQLALRAIICCSEQLFFLCSFTYRPLGTSRLPSAVVFYQAEYEKTVLIKKTTVKIKAAFAPH